MRRPDPVVVAIIIGMLVISGGIVYDTHNTMRERDAFTESCTIMGGTPLIGLNDAKVCLNNDFVLSVK